LDFKKLLFLACKVYDFPSPLNLKRNLSYLFQTNKAISGRKKMQPKATQ